MNRPHLTTTIAVATLLVFAALTSTASATVTFDWATVGNAGNAADPTTGFGAVAYVYRISKTEVTNAQYAEFLNAVAASDPHSLYNLNMGLNPLAGITQAGSSGSFTYGTTTNMASKPVNFVSFFDAMRFSNWLHNGQGSGDTETGVYGITNGLSEARDPNATFFLPSEDEWYKAAYHQSAAQGGDSDNYWLYPTASNSVPTVATANSVGDISNPGTNVANYSHGADWNGQDGNVTTVGSAGPNSASFYGTFDQGGNVWEWNETPVTSSTRGVRGGPWNGFGTDLRSSFRSDNGPAGGDLVNLGFRVASPVPEPGTLALLGLGLPVLLRRRHGHIVVDVRQLPASFDG